MKPPRRPTSLLLSICLIALLAGPACAATLVVSNTLDSGPGSLRQAILDSNASIGADTIIFNLPGGGVHTISPASALPTITDHPYSGTITKQAAQSLRKIRAHSTMTLDDAVNRRARNAQPSRHLNPREAVVLH